jgi:hypothetical protein
MFVEVGSMRARGRCPDHFDHQTSDPWELAVELLKVSALAVGTTGPNDSDPVRAVRRKRLGRSDREAQLAK